MRHFVCSTVIAVTNYGHMVPVVLTGHAVGHRRLWPARLKHASVLLGTCDDHSTREYMHAQIVVSSHSTMAETLLELSVGLGTQHCPISSYFVDLQVALLLSLAHHQSTNSRYYLQLSSAPIDKAKKSRLLWFTHERLLAMPLSKGS